MPPGFEKRISTVNKPDHKSLIKLAEDYHNQVCNNEECIIYEKNSFEVKTNIELTCGSTFYPDLEIEGNSINENNFVIGGVIFNLWMPRVNEKLYFRTGMQFSSFEMNSEVVNYLNTPFGFEYKYSKGVVRPTLSYGIELYFPKGYEMVHFVNTLGGVDIQVGENIEIGINYNIDFLPVYGIIPYKIFSNTIMGGLIINFE